MAYVAITQSSAPFSSWRRATVLGHPNLFYILSSSHLFVNTPSDLNLITRKSKYRDIWNNMFLIIGDKIKEKFDTYLKNQYSNTEYLGACLVDFQIFSFYQVVIKDSQTTEFKAIQDIDITTTHPFESKFDTKFMLPMIAKEQQSSIELAGAYSYQERKQKVKTYCKHYYRLLTLEKIIKECKRQLDLK